MTKCLIVYDTRYGNTKLVAEKIAEGVADSGNFELSVKNVREVEDQEIGHLDLLVIGTPTHFGTSTRMVSKFIERLKVLHPAIGSIAFFSTYFGGDYGKAVKKMENKIASTSSWVNVIAPGLSIDVKATKGPVAEEELSKSVQFGRSLNRKPRSTKTTP